MNQKDALKKLQEKKKYIDDDVFNILKVRVEKDIKKEIEDENEKFTKKATFILRQEGITPEDLKNMILSQFYEVRLLRDFIS